MPNQEKDEEERALFEGVDKLSRQLEIPQVFDAVLNPGDRRQARQRRQDEMERGRDQIAQWFDTHVIRRKIVVDAEEVNKVRWDRNNSSFADVLLLANVDEEEELETIKSIGIPLGSSGETKQIRRRKTLYPAHRAMLLRSELYALMFASPFREGQITSSLPDEITSTEENLQVIPVECSAAVLEIILTFLYTEKAEFSLDIALDVLHAADMLFLEKLKQRAALLISTLGNGTQGGAIPQTRGQKTEEQPLEWIYEVVRSGWDCRVQRLEEFGARYIADRLERYIKEDEFKELVAESAARISGRQETDTVEIIDDIRFYLDERYKLRMEDADLAKMMEDDEAIKEAAFEEIEGKPSHEDEGYSGSPAQHGHGEEVIRTLDGGIVDDEFAQNAINYQILLGKIDTLLEELELDA